MPHEFRYALRLLRKSPGFSAAAVLTLGLGIGANTAIFSVVYALALRPLPLDHPEHLVFLAGSNPLRPGGTMPFSVPAYESLREGATTFTGIAAFAGERLTLTGAGDPAQLNAIRASGNFFDVLGVPPLAGRAFHDADGSEGALPVALIGEGLWQRRFASDPAVLGRSLTLSGTPHTIVGIVPRGFTIPYDDTEVWVTRLTRFGSLTEDQIRHGGGFLMGIARLKSGVGVQQADADVAVVNRRYRVQHAGSPDADPNARIMAAPLQDSLIADVDSTLQLLTAAAAVVLLIACSNVAGLLVARSAGRSREIAVRAALGARRARIVGQLLVESALLSAAGAVCGAIVAAWGVQFLGRAEFGLPGIRPIQLDGVALAFCAAVALITGVAFGLIPALQASRPDLNRVLRDAARGSVGVRRRPARRILVAAQVALAVVLLTGAGLLLESLRRLEQVRPGFDPGHAMTMRISLPPVRYPDDPRRTQFIHDTLDRIEALPGVRSASASLAIPMSIGVMAPFLAEGQPPTLISQRPLGEWKAITPGYFRTMGIPLLRGRAFTWSDDAAAPRRVIVSQSLARVYFGAADPIGKRITYARREVPAEIVGVAGDVKSRGLDSDDGIVYYTPYPQFAWPNLAITFRAAGDPRLLASAVQSQIFTMDRDLPVTAIQTLDDYVQNALTGRRRVFGLIAGFAALALLLSVIGLYAVLAHSIAEREGEIGVRQAIGARPSDILRMVLAETLRLAAAGIAAGIAAAAVAARLLSGMLFHVSPADPATFAAVAALILAVGLAAGWFPARRAMRVNPVDALRRQ